jgi:hypothetical protein
MLESALGADSVFPSLDIQLAFSGRFDELNPFRDRLRRKTLCDAHCIQLRMLHLAGTRLPVPAEALWTAPIFCTSSYESTGWLNSALIF